jgi:hypothetical protein
MPFSAWRKSSFSDQSGSDCVEVAFTTSQVAVRDSKNPTGPVLTLSVEGWVALVTSRAPLQG